MSDFGELGGEAAVSQGKQRCNTCEVLVVLFFTVTDGKSNPIPPAAGQEGLMSVYVPAVALGLSLNAGTLFCN